jgi:hypothetical protein
MLLDSDPHSQYGSGSRRTKSLRIRMRNPRCDVRVPYLGAGDVLYFLVRLLQLLLSVRFQSLVLLVLKELGVTR